MALNELQWAALASRKGEREPLMAVDAMDTFYGQYEIGGRPANQDPGLANLLYESRIGAQSGAGVGVRLGQAVSFYSNQFETEYTNSNIPQIRDWITGSGFNQLPQGLIQFIASPDHQNLTYDALRQGAEDENNEEREDYQKAVRALEVLDRQVFDGQLAPTVIRQQTTGTLNALYQQNNQEE
jgi:hypothetical protein